MVPEIYSSKFNWSKDSVCVNRAQGEKKKRLQIRVHLAQISIVVWLELP